MPDRHEWALIAGMLIGFVLLAAICVSLATANPPRPVTYFLTCVPGDYRVGAVVYHWKCQ